MKETVHFTIGPLLGEQLLEIAQTNISNGNVEYGSSIYMQAFEGFNEDLTLKVLKNQFVVVTDEDGTGINLTDDPKAIEENAHNIFDWNHILNSHFNDIMDIRESLTNVRNKFVMVYHGDILDYSIIEMMERYFDPEQLSKIGIHNIAARIIGSPDCKISDKGNSNPASIWERLENRVEEDFGKGYMSSSKYEKVLYYTVKYNKLIRLLHKSYLDFEKTYFYLVENGFVERFSKIEYYLENTIKTLMEFADDTKGYYHPLCNTGLYEYKNKLHEDILSTRIGKEYCRDGIVKKNIMDGYDAGWLSPDGEFYGADGDTSSMIHMNIAEEIFRGNNVYANRMDKDGVSTFGGTNSPDYWLESHGWIKTHHNECYGSFIGRRNEEPTKDFPYSYNPTEIQIKMICDYADKFYGGKFLTEASCVGIKDNPEVSTFKVRQMDEFQIHKTFAR